MEISLAVTSRRERAKADKRRRIVEASRNLFARNGYEGTTVQQIADEADIAVGTLFLYVRDKSDLLMLLFSERMEEAVADARRFLDDKRPLKRSLVRFFERLMHFYEENPELSLLFWRELLLSPPESRARVDQITGSVIEALRDRVEIAKARLEIASDVDPSIAALHLYAIFHATISFHLVRCAPFSSSRETLTRLIESFWKGLNRPI